MNPLNWGAAEWGAFGQVGALAVAVVAGVLIWLQVRQGRQIREDQTRPYVIVDFEFRGFLVLISVRNIGTTPATNVRISFDPPLRTPTKTIRPERFAVFSEPIAMLAPGRRIRVFFGSGPDIFSEDAGDVTLRFVATVKYSDLEGTRVYADPPSILDLAPFKYSSVDPDDLHQIAQRIKGIEQAMKRWTSSGRLKVNTVTQAEIDERDTAFWEAQEAAERAARAEDPAGAD